jgi:glutamate-1-semialdehyde 2,1-aminomutase
MNSLNTIAFDRASRLMPGGVSSPVRAFKAVGGKPVFISRAQGPFVFDLEGRRFIDLVMSYGPLILGHAHPQVVASVVEQASRGFCYGMPTTLEADVADKIASAMPAIEQVRLVNSGTEAAMSAVRLARAATGRDLIVKCAGCYHGHVDALLVEAGSGALTHGVPTSPGVPAALSRSTLVVPFNDLDAVRHVFEAHRDQIACFAVEPVVGNVGVVVPTPGYLKGLRDLCDEFGVLLLFDEVMTGFRVARGGAAGRFGVRPDLTCLGKIIGGGLPVGAYGGSARVMSLISPQGPVYQAGTLSGNPMTTTAGLATLNLLDDELYRRLEQLSSRLEVGLRQAARDVGCPITINRVGSMMTLFFTDAFDQPVIDETSALRADRDRFAKFFHAMLDAGVMLPPSAFEAWFLSVVHDDSIIDQIISASVNAFRAALVVRSR